MVTVNSDDEGTELVKPSKTPSKPDKTITKEEHQLLTSHDI